MDTHQNTQTTGNGYFNQAKEIIRKTHQEIETLLMEIPDKHSKEFQKVQEITNILKGIETERAFALIDLPDTEEVNLAEVVPDHSDDALNDLLNKLAGFGSDLDALTDNSPEIEE